MYKDDEECVILAFDNHEIDAMIAGDRQVDSRFRFHIESGTKAIITSATNYAQLIAEFYVEEEK